MTNTKILAGAAVKESLTGAIGAPPTADQISAALAAPGCERLRDFYETGPVQRASLQTFADALGVDVPRTSEQKGEA